MFGNCFIGNEKLNFKYSIINRLDKIQKKKM